MNANYDSATDSDLLRACERDPKPFELLFERHAAPMRAWLASRVGDVAIANDLLAETFAQAWRSRRRFSGKEPGAGTAWLYGIARNLLRQHYKRGRVETSARRRLGMVISAPHEDDLDAVLERVDADALRIPIESALRALPAGQRRAIDERVVRGLDYRELADELHLNTDNARARVSRGLRTLRTILKGVQA
jgi:RNA polymerase sigma-70 factor (ECF subfamily)